MLMVAVRNGSNTSLQVGGPAFMSFVVIIASIIVIVI
jgi:hypothetical protein